MSRLFYSPKASGAQVSILTHTHIYIYRNYLSINFDFISLLLERILVIL